MHIIKMDLIPQIDNKGIRNRINSHPFNIIDHLEGIGPLRQEEYSECIEISMNSEPQGEFRVSTWWVADGLLYHPKILTNSLLEAIIA